MQFACCLLLVCPSAGPDLHELPPDISITLQQPGEPLRLGEPMMMQLSLASQCRAPLEVGPFAVEHNGYLDLEWTSHVCGKGICRSEVRSTTSTVDVVIERIVQRNSTGEDEEEVIEEILVEEQWPDSWFEFTLSPGETATVDFDLMKTKLANLIDRPGRYRVSLTLQSETKFSDGYRLPKLRWQGRASSNVVHIHVVEGD